MSLIQTLLRASCSSVLNVNWWDANLPNARAVPSHAGIYTWGMLTAPASTHSLLESAKKAARGLAQKNRNVALEHISHALLEFEAEILEANVVDVALERQKGTSDALLDRLSLSPKRLEAVREGIAQVVALPDPLGRVLEGWRHENGLSFEKVTVPFGVIGMVYESRPNVTVDAAVLCLKAGSSVVLRGSSSALQSNRVLVKAMQVGLERAGLPRDAVQLIDSTDRSSVTELITARGLVDLVIPRGGAGLIAHVVENAKVPVIETGVGNCHLYVDSSADLEMALNILLNGKVQRPGVCNSLEKLLVHYEVAPIFLPLAVKALREAGVEVRGDDDAQLYAPGVVPALESDWSTEYLDFIIAVKVVKTLSEALEHIHTFSSGHSEAIVTRSLESATRFETEVDAAAVYVNASTRFTDGFEFGFGAEIGISTQKLHARGPMGLREMVSYQFRARGNGQIRG